MSFVDVLYTTLIGPLQLLFEMIYMVANKLIGNPGLSIVVLSLIMNFLVLPLYRRSDIMQEEARDVEKKLAEGVSHIKKTFTGDERMMILQTYYRQNHYKPTNSLNGSISLLLEIPFFMAAYNFLSHLDVIQGASLGPIADLGAPDGLLVIGDISINLLPIIMTSINIVSSAIYAKDFPLKTKIQLFGMALIFLVFLYSSPAGLVFYWTLNNIFSLGKTLFYKLRNFRKILNVSFFIVGSLILYFASFIYNTPSLKARLLVVGFGLVCELPILFSWLGKNNKPIKRKVSTENNKKLFVLGSLFLIILVGLLIPSTLLATSPQEFIDITYFYNPKWYIVNALCLAIGSFGVWIGVFYWIASPSVKVVMDKGVWILCSVMLINYMFFGTDLGVISSSLQYENGMIFTPSEELFNLFVLVVAGLVMYIIVQKWERKLMGVLLTAVFALGGMSGQNIATINESILEAKVNVAQIEDRIPEFDLSRTGKNVIVLMLDRGMSQYIPYIFNEKPELQEKFDGFTFYSNTIAHGGFTNFGSPGLFGGYEYTPIEMNKRSSESLVSKHNEALKVMPVLFGENGYDVTVCDPPYANYQWVPDLSIYDEYPEIDTYITDGKFNDIVSNQFQTQANRRNFFCFSVMKTMPLCIQETIYNGGNYNQSTGLLSQTVLSNMTSEGISSQFMKPYNVLVNLENMTRITSEESNTFMMMANNMTHEPMMLQEPDYVPAQYVDNTPYYLEDMDRFIVNNVTLNMENALQIQHYQTNMAAMIQLGKYFDYMREHDVYDNTRIIIVSDHGRPLEQIESLIYAESDENLNLFDLEFYFALLMVKDFNGEGFSVSDEFMTNADVPSIAVDNLIENPINPFTGNIINNQEKTAHEQYVIASLDYRVSENNGNTFLPAKWYAVSEDAWNRDNWRLIDEEVVLPTEVIHK